MTVELRAADADGGLGTKEVSYSATGAKESLSVTVPGYSAQLDVVAEGQTVVTYHAVDHAANSEESKTVEVRIDGTKPSGSVRINSGATRTKSRKVTLKILSNDPVPSSKVASMRRKNGGGTWSAWQPCGPSRAWTLSGGTGRKTVYVQYLDSAGNLSSRG